MDNQEMGRTVSPDEREREIVLNISVLRKDFRRLLKKFWWIVILAAVLMAELFYVRAYAGYVPMYESKATFTVATGNEESGNYNFYYSQNTADQLSRTFSYLLDSSYFNSVLLEELGEQSLDGTISAETVKGSNVVTMKVHSRKAETASQILESALKVYPDTARFVLGNIQFHMIGKPDTSLQPYNEPVLWRILANGAAVGGISGVLFLLLLAYFRRTAKTPEEMEEITSLKCLAVIPEVKQKARKRKKGKKRVSALDQRAPYGFREGMRALQIRTELAMKKKEAKVLLVTSTAAGEGKSTVAVNLAELLASKGKNVLLIDGDLRKQEDAKVLNCGDGMGLQDLCEQGEELKVQIRPLEKSRLWFFGGTHTTQNTANVLSHPRVGAFMKAARKKMDYIILDTPPYGVFQDAILLAEYADEILYVIKYDSVPQKEVIEGLSFINEGKSRILGYVLNAYPQSTNVYGYGGYGYKGYGYKGETYQKDYEKKKVRQF